MPVGFKISLPKGSILEIQTSPSTWAKITEHNRNALEITTERIEDIKRMANGTLRKFYVADKRTISTSWEFVPSGTKYLVDSADWSVENLKQFYNSSAGRSSFVIKIRRHEGSDTHETLTVIFTKFDYSIVKRGVDTFYNLDIEMQEV